MVVLHVLDSQKGVGNACRGGDVAGRGDLYSRDGVAFLAIGNFGCLRFVHLVVKRSQLVLGEMVDNAGTQAVSHHVCHGAEAIPTGGKINR